MKYVIEISPQDCGKVFGEYGEVSTDTSILLEHPEKVALVVFTGGEDVWPELYGEKASWSTFYSVKRDLYEGEMFEQANKHNIPCVGICRGAQFLCVKAGGKLVQDITGHGCHHLIATNDGQVFEANSSHHQMQLPPEDAVVLGWAYKNRSIRYLNGNDENMKIEKEIEVVYYPNINAVGIQYHPEWLNEKHPCVLYGQEVVRNHLFGTKKIKKAA